MSQAPHSLDPIGVSQTETEASKSAQAPTSGLRKRERPDLVRIGRKRLSFWERAIIRFVRRTLEPGRLDRFLRFCQRTVGQSWIHHFTKHLRQVHGVERLPPLNGPESIIFVANHRSFFDLYVITAELVRRGMKKRIVFPVRSGFFYDSPVGLFVNGVMSFFSMYPPIFRSKKKATLNLHGLSELGFLLSRGGVFVGMHPEGTRKRDDDPYTFLPAQPGVGKVIFEARTQVVPVFVNGLINDLPRQVKSNFDGTGKPIHVVFGRPIDLADLLAERGSPRVHRAIAERCMRAIGELGQEEKALRQGPPLSQ